MATTKKTTTATKKTRTATKPAASKATSTTTRKKPVVQKTAAKKTAAKKPTAKKATTPESSFMTVRPTVETAYWILFGVAIIALALWVLTLTIKINEIYDQIDANDTSINALHDKEMHEKTVKKSTQE